MTIQLLEDAENDLLKARDFYEKQCIGLGNYFIDSISLDIDSLLLYFGIHSKYMSFHRLLSKNFPYYIYYTIEKNVIKVWAVLDCRQHPDKIFNRLRTD